MKIEGILSNLGAAKPAAPASTKVASAAPTPAAPAAAPVRDALRAALGEALTTAKTASEAVIANPVSDLEKIAAELAAKEAEADERSARLMARAFADEVVSSISAWQKTASANLPAVASEEQLKQAAEAGYRQAVADMQKQAADDYDRGYNETVETIHKVASVQFIHAAKKTAALVRLAAQG